MDTLFETLALFNERTEPIQQADMQIVAETIAHVNQCQRQRQTDTMHTFTLATHPRIGRDSAVYRVFYSSPLYDAYLLLHIWRYIYIAEWLPTFQLELEVMEQSCMRHANNTS